MAEDHKERISHFLEMSVFEKIKRGKAIVVELPVYRGLEAVFKTFKVKADGFLIPDIPSGRIGPDGLAISSKLQDVRRLILAQAAGRRDLSSNLSRIEGGMLIGLDTFYVVQGDVRRGCGVTATELIRQIKERYPEAKVGASIFPGRVNEVELTVKKLDAGADFFITQICFEAGPLLKILDEVGIDQPLLLALTVNIKPDNLDKMVKLGINVPSNVYERIRASNDPRLESLKLGFEIYQRVKEGAKNPIGLYLIPFGDLEGLRDMLAYLNRPLT